ncbi:MAG: DUF2510 domain-containing protein [Acidimicrobiales bacterium]|nr:DUF2510 domain-containing protein [Acidimicrobiales bacterium]
MGETAGTEGDEPAPEPGWQHDPFERHAQRWWNGTSWTERVRDGELAGIDPPGIHTAPRGASTHVPADGITPATRPVRWKSTRLPAMIAVSVVVLVAIVALIAVVALGG